MIVIVLTIIVDIYIYIYIYIYDVYVCVCQGLLPIHGTRVNCGHAAKTHKLMV